MSWGGRRESMGHWNVRAADDDARIRVEAIDHWQVRVYARYQLIGPKPEPVAPPIPCDMCSLRPANLWVHHDGANVGWCQECRDENEPDRSLAYKRPFWLRILKWLAKL